MKSMYTARKEAGETQNHLCVLQLRGYISQRIKEDKFRRYQELIRGINGYVKYIVEKRQRNNPK